MVRKRIASQENASGSLLELRGCDGSSHARRIARYEKDVKKPALPFDKVQGKRKKLT